MVKYRNKAGNRKYHESQEPNSGFRRVGHRRACNNYDHEYAKPDQYLEHRVISQSKEAAADAGYLEL